MSPNGRKSTIAFALCLAVLPGALAPGCGGAGQDTVDPGSANAESAITLAEARTEVDAPPALASLRKQANEIVEGGPAAFDARLARLEGNPVVVNKWASWCGPCREEFPYFQSQAIERADEVAFIGLLSNDGPETGATFLSQLPLPYPSYLDSDVEIAESLEIAREFPTTLFFDADGKLAYTKRGPYTSEDELVADLDRYAR